MKILTAAQMGEIDRRTEEAGIPNSILMENAGHRVVEFYRNGGRFYRSIVSSCFVAKATTAATDLLSRDNFLPGFGRSHCMLPRPIRRTTRMLYACYGRADVRFMTPSRRKCAARRWLSTLCLGPDSKGPARDKAAEWIREINSSFLNAKVIAVDVPSGMDSDSGKSER